MAKKKNLSYVKKYISFLLNRMACIIICDFKELIFKFWGSPSVTKND